LWRDEGRVGTGLRPLYLLHPLFLNPPNGHPNNKAILREKMYVIALLMYLIHNAIRGINQPCYKINNLEKWRVVAN
jgi:hypothetical protein